MKKKSKDLDNLGRHKALAHMMGGFVHQLRTPLHIIQSSAEDLAQMRRFMPNFKPQTEMIVRSAQRMESSVNALLKFVKGDKPSLEPGSLNKTVEQLGDFLAEECRKRSVTVEKRLSSQRSVRLDPYHLQEALINLLMNALQAMPQGGLLSIKTEDLPSKNKVLLEIRDSGKGMTKDRLAKLAVPFQTGKKNGMGLGVYFSRRILKQHHATLRFDSAPGRGTTVTILFPAL